MENKNTNTFKWLHCIIDPDHELSCYEIRKCAHKFGLSSSYLRKVIYHDTIPDLSFAFSLSRYFNKTVDECWMNLEVTV